MSNRAEGQTFEDAAPREMSELVGEAASRRDLSGHAVPRAAAFGVAFVLTALLSGGLILGTTPFQEALVNRFDYSQAVAEATIARAFQVFVFGSAILAPTVDIFGPRVCAAVGLALQAGCLLVISKTGSITHSVVSLALGGMGIGGNMLTYGAMTFPQLYKGAHESDASHDGLLTNVLTAAYQVSGFVFAVLPHVDFQLFFRWYALLAALGACVAVAAFPDEQYDSSKDVPRVCQVVRLCRVSASFGICNAVEALKAPRTWLFFLTFGVTATCANWGLSIFFGVAKDSAVLIQLMPFLANSTFFFAPCIGALVDNRGFAIPVLLLGMSAVAFANTIWLLPLAWQWITLIALNVLQAFVYGLQFSYINKTYAGGAFGVLMSLSCLVQTAISPLSLIWDSRSRGKGAVLFTVLSSVLAVVWAAVQAGQRSQSAEPRSSQRDGDSERESGTSLSAELELSTRSSRS